MASGDDTRFESLVKGGFFSSNPDHPGSEVPVRTNNPAWLTTTPWQQQLAGFVGVLAGSQTNKKDNTVIYRTPEHGVAAWYALLADHCGFKKDGAVSVLKLADKYGGGDWSTKGAGSFYLTGWKKHLPQPGQDSYRFANDHEMLVLAKAMFAHELDVLGNDVPWSDAQILYGIRHQRAGTMPK